MESKAKGLQQLAALELEVEAKYRELARQEFERRLQELADEQGRFSPLKRSGSGSMPEDRDDAGDNAGQS